MIFLRILALLTTLLIGGCAAVSGLFLILVLFGWPWYLKLFWLVVTAGLLWVMWRLMAFALGLRQTPGLGRSWNWRRTGVIVLKIALSFAVIWLFGLGPLAPWQVVLTDPMNSAQPGSAKMGAYFMSYESCQKHLIQEINKHEGHFPNGYCGQGCWPDSYSIADRVSCYQMWGAREL